MREAVLDVGSNTAHLLVVDRSIDVAAAANHWSIEGSSPTFPMSAIAVPTLVMHGTEDPLFPLPHGEALAAEIPNARLVTLAGVGHEVPPPALWDTVVDEITRHTAMSTGSTT